MSHVWVASSQQKGPVAGVGALAGVEGRNLCAAVFCGRGRSLAAMRFGELSSVCMGLYCESIHRRKDYPPQAGGQMPVWGLHGLWGEQSWQECAVVMVFTGEVPCMRGIWVGWAGRGRFAQKDQMPLRVSRWSVLWEHGLMNWGIWAGLKSCEKRVVGGRAAFCKTHVCMCVASIWCEGGGGGRRVQWWYSWAECLTFGWACLRRQDLLCWESLPVS